MYYGYLWAVLIGFDQLGNALTGGHPDVTISARLGKAQSADEGWLMQFLARVVDFAFRPTERHHCRDAYEAQLDENFSKLRRGNDVGLVFLGLIILVFAVPVFVANFFRSRFQ